jgi:Ca-activated chloride channel family protein
MSRFREHSQALRSSRVTQLARTAATLQQRGGMRNALAVLLLLTLSCTTTRQAPVAVGRAGVIEGEITDTTGVALPGIMVDVIDAAKAHRSAVTDAQGRYRIERLAPGRYAVVAQLAGFVTVTRQVTLTPEHGVALSTALSIESVSETITVTAEAASSWNTTNIVTKSASGEPFPRSKRFEDHKFVSTKKERVTTFAIDVDRASYANVRRYLADGELPPRDAVRIEEMVNYFHWSYPQPEGDAAFSITSEVAGCPWNTQNRLVRIDIQGRELDQWKMAPNNLVFLIDVSGSMQSQERLPLLQSALHVLVDQLRAEDRVSIVVYAGAAGLVLPSTSGADKAAIFAAIDRLQAGGSTAGAEGIDLAYKIAKENFVADGNNRVILATDGDFNVGTYDILELQKLIEEKRKTGVFLSVIGVGDDGNDELMETLADNGNGTYAFLDSQREAERVFRDELTGTLVTIAKDVKVQIEFDPAAVASYRQIGYENRALANKDFDDDTKDAGELGAGHSVTALFEIVPAAQSSGKIATVRLRYKEPNGAKSTPIETSIVDEGRSAYEASPDMQFAAAIAQFGMLLRHSQDKGSASWDDVLQLARIARGADLDGTREEFVRIAEGARSLDR